MVLIWYRLGGYSNEHVRAFGPTVTEVGIRIAPLLYKGGEDTLVAWHCMALRKVWLGIPGGEKPSGHMRIEAVQLLKNGIPFFTKVKSPSPTKHELTRPLEHPASQIRRQPAERPNEHARVLEPATVTEVGIRIVPLSRHSDGMAQTRIR